MSRDENAASLQLAAADINKCGCMSTDSVAKRPSFEIRIRYLLIDGAVERVILRTSPLLQVRGVR